MRLILLFSWLALPIAGVAYHYGPGQELVQLDDVAAIIARAESAVADEDWTAAIAGYDEALQKLPGDRAAMARRLRLERCKAELLDHKLPVASGELATLVGELQNDAQADAQLLRESRQALASSQFYMTWLMRLEGKAREEWEPQIEGARQNYRLLAEDADERGDAKQGKLHRTDLESAIRLARLEIQDLQGLPIPSQ